MSDTEFLPPNYARARNVWPDAPTLAGSYEALRNCLNGGAHGKPEHIQSFIETFCRTVLHEYGSPQKAQDLRASELLIEALRCLGMNNRGGETSLNRLLSAFRKMTDALADLRNNCGPVAHGKDGFVDPLSADLERAFLYAGDAVLGCLLSALQGSEPDLSLTREPYSRFRRHHRVIDSTVEIGARIDEDDDVPIFIITIETKLADDSIELKLQPSKLLYGVDRNAYIDLLRRITLSREHPIEESLPEEGSEDVALPGLFLDRRIAQDFVVDSDYSGPLSPLREELEIFLLQSGLTEPSRLTSSLLSVAEANMPVDWERRSDARASMKVEMKRVFIHAGIAVKAADRLASSLVDWFKPKVRGLQLTTNE